MLLWEWPMYDVITVGSATVDLFAHTEFSEQVHKKTRKGEAKLIAYPVGAKILINRFELTSDEVPWRTLRHTRWFYFSSMVGESYKSLEKIAEFAAGRRISIAFNPSLYQAKEGAKRLRRVLSSTTILILNREEAKCLG